MKQILSKRGIFFFLFLFFSFYSKVGFSLLCEDEFVVTVENKSGVTVYIKFSDSSETLTATQYEEGNRGNMVLSPKKAIVYCTSRGFMKFSPQLHGTSSSSSTSAWDAFVGAFGGSTASKKYDTKHKNYYTITNNSKTTDPLLEVTVSFMSDGELLIGTPFATSIN